MALRKIQHLVIAGDAAGTAELHGSHYLAEANAAVERGNHEKSERLYEKAQEWLDEANRLRKWR